MSTAGFFTVSGQNLDITEFESSSELRREKRLHNAATSYRQSLEWGMRALQASFPRLKDRFIFEMNGERRRILKMIVLLYNYRTCKVGINQIKNTFTKCLEVDANTAYGEEIHQGLVEYTYHCF